MKILKKAASALLGSSWLVAGIFVSLQSSVMAGNVKLGDLGQSDLDAYCARKINRSNGKIIATLADTHVKCQVEISESGSSKTQAEINASAAGKRARLEGSVSAGVKSGSQWQATFTSYQNSYHLNEWCRDKYASKLYYFQANPFTGKGRIFVGDGGHACYKTE